MKTESVAIIVPGLVAIAAIAATWHQHRRMLDQQRELADLTNVRGVLDDAAIALHDVAYLLDNVRSYLVQRDGVSFFKTDEGTETYKALGDRGRDLDALVERLSVRLGPQQAAVVAFRAADAAVLDIWRSAGRLRHEPEADGDPSAARQIRTLNDETRECIAMEREAFDDARAGFVIAAHETAGSRLG